MNSFLRLIKKIKPITPEQLTGKALWFFGCGLYAQNLINQWHPTVLGFVCMERDRLATELFVQGNTSVIEPAEVVGSVVLASGVFQYRLNQLLSLSAADFDAIEHIFIVDEFQTLRIQRAKAAPSSKRLLISKLGVIFPEYDRFLDPIRLYAKNRGIDVATICPLFMHCYPEFIEADNLLIWGGVKSPYLVLDDLKVSGHKSYIEYGFFPQKNYYYFDKKGVNENCTLMTDNLDWVEHSHIAKLDEIKSDFLPGFQRISEDYVLIPLQVPDDANVIYASRFQNGMQEFIDYICAYYPKGTQLLFKAHPKDHARKTYNYQGHACSDLPFTSLMQHAKLVHGITSSTLYEAALAGLPVISEGNSLLNKHSGQVAKLLAAMVDRQVHVQQSNLEYHLHRYSNFIF